MSNIRNEAKDLIGKLQEQGYSVERTKKNHYKVRKNGKCIATLPGTPSDWRSLRNCIAVLKRSGFEP